MNHLPAIVIPAYSRPKSLVRLLRSINAGHYPRTDISLIISLEGGADHEVFRIAEDFSFCSGEKKLVYHKEPLGLRKHILWCGDQTEKYGAIILLEDDLLVDPFYYIYAAKALQFYRADKGVSGIALYAPCRNEYVNLPFRPMHNGTSTYPMQVPCSWGQAWSKNQWMKFRSWYENKNEPDVENCLGVPDFVKKWPETSWKKYYATYLVENNLCFIYPYVSLTTNCCDAGGTHITYGTDVHQVSLPSPLREKEGDLNFILTNDSPVLYDSFFEPSSTMVQKMVIFLSDKQFEVDFYATKPINLLKRKKFVITTKNTTNPIDIINIHFRPIELNLYNNIDQESSLKAYISESINVQDIRLDIIRYNLEKYYSNIEISILKNKYRKEGMDYICSSISWKISKPLRITGKLMNNIIKYFDKK